MHEVLKRGLIGIGISGIFSFVMLTLLTLYLPETELSIVWSNMLGSLLLGIYFSMASFIFDNDRWSPLKQLVLHFIFSVVFFFPIATTLGWIPLHPIPLAIGVVIFIVSYVFFWFGIRGYLKWLEKSMNSAIKN